MPDDTSSIQRPRRPASGSALPGSEGTAPSAAPPLMRRNLPMLLLLVRERMLTRFRPVLGEKGLTEQQWRILRVVHDAGRLEQHQIAAACGLLAPSLAGVLARMEGLGLVERTRLAHDQRRIEVGLTDQSRALVTELAPRIEAVYRQLEAEIDPDAMANLEHCLDAVLAALDRERR